MIIENGTLLVGLDDVNWAGLSHAYGSAEDVPGQIRALCGNDEAARERAFGSLFNNIFHQGSRYQASPVAVPFLARIAVAGPPAAREDTMWLLTRLAVDWYEEHRLTTTIDTVAWRAAASECSPEKMLSWYDEQLAGETDEQQREQLLDIRGWVAAGNSPDARWTALHSYDAVLTELPGLLALLDDSDPRLRTRIAYLTAWFPESAPTMLPRLLPLAEREHDPVVVATALVAVGLVGTPAYAADLTPYLDGKNRLVRWAAATALARIASDSQAGIESALVDRAVAELTASAAGPAPASVTDYNAADFRGHVERTLRALDR
ncbi:HEAT repeat domain-containing protein [Streptomyces sp. NPDC127119]|uniref:HEAT repeat domain-containing protein n=1 Tax=Streptomyces sp. NPDC127119 TaxID=3345370 RepID=UPI003627DA45